MDFLILLRCLIANVWNLCLTVRVPGLDISFAALFISLFIFSIGLFVLKVSLFGSFDGAGVVEDGTKIKDHVSSSRAFSARQDYARKWFG